MAVAPNHKKLIVPKKQMPKAHAGYSDDMRTIEQWANDQVNGVSQLIAGTNITLDPTNGEGVVTINSTGGGGGGLTWGRAQLVSGPDSAALEGAGDVIFLGPTAFSLILGSIWAVQSNPTGVGQQWTWASSWIIFPAPGQSVCVLPEIITPTFTGSFPCLGECQIAAWANDDSTVNLYQGSFPNLTSGSSIQIAASAFTPVTVLGSDLTLTAGTGTTGNGLVSAGATAHYYASCVVQFSVPGGTTFT